MSSVVREKNKKVFFEICYSSSQFDITFSIGPS